MKILVAFLILFSTVFSSAFATGKLTLQNNFPDGGTKYRPTVGLSVYESITKSMAVNFWTGYGEQFLEERKDVNWWVSKAQLDLKCPKFPKFTVSPGVQFKVLPSEEDKQREAVGFVRLDWQLW